MILDKQLKDGIKPNANPLITNLTGLTLTAEETEVLMLGLKHGLATRPKETEIIVIVEGIWDQLERLEEPMVYQKLIKNVTLSRNSALSSILL